MTVDAGTLAMGGVAIIAGNGGNDTGNGTVTLTNGGVMTSNGLAVLAAERSSSEPAPAPHAIQAPAT